MGNNGTSARSASNIMTTSNFEAFFRGWLVRQEQYLGELRLAHESINEDYKRDLINRVLDHYLQYFDAKSLVARQNIFLLFSPHWFSSLERSLMWITGFRLALVFQLVDVEVHGLSAEQRQRMSTLQENARTGTRILNNELSRIHESIAAPPLYELAMQYSRHIAPEIIHEVTERMRAELERVVTNADLLRTGVTGVVVEILNTRQCIEFLTAVAQLQTRIRSWGLHIDAERRV
ncbi:hypothetical protein ACFE04_022467 [Oxalis oulophora]